MMVYHQRLRKIGGNKIIHSQVRVISFVSHIFMSDISEESVAQAMVCQGGLFKASKASQMTAEKKI